MPAGFDAVSSFRVCSTQQATTLNPSTSEQSWEASIVMISALHVVKGSSGTAKFPHSYNQRLIE